MCPFDRTVGNHEKNETVKLSTKHAKKEHVRVAKCTDEGSLDKKSCTQSSSKKLVGIFERVCVQIRTLYPDRRDGGLARKEKMESTLLEIETKIHRGQC